jgi:DNA-binding MarR family transcriptional regulator
MNTEMEQIVKLVKVMKGMKKIQENYLKNVGSEYKLTGAQIEVLWIISHRDGITFTELSELALLHLSTAMHLVNNLQKNSLVKKRNSTRDKRTWHVHITPEGKRIINEIIDKYINSNHPIMSVAREVEAEQEMNVQQFIDFGMQLVKKMNGEDYFKWVDQNSKEISHHLIKS